MRPDLASMTKVELRDYVVQHPKDTEAFHLWVDRATAEAPAKWHPALKSMADLPELERILRDKIDARGSIEDQHQQAS
jgi:hypothetical protein